MKEKVLVRIDRVVMGNVLKLGEEEISEVWLLGTNI